MTKTVADAAAMLEVMSGACDRDSTCLDAPVPRYSEEIGKEIKGLRIGLPAEYFATGLDPAVHERVEGAVKTLESLGAEIVPVSLPNTGHAPSPPITSSPRPRLPRTSPASTASATATAPRPTTSSGCMASPATKGSARK